MAAINSTHHHQTRKAPPSGVPFCLPAMGESSTEGGSTEAGFAGRMHADTQVQNTYKIG
jgi:hypothetical protein